MCYSAQIQADYRKYVRMFGAHMTSHEVKLGHRALIYRPVIR
ncbi:hypothetical protein R69749_08235 [Paraburkholderia domus]|nr:hypothetical protein R69749_08235 [Paraburkholderia domus]